MHMKRNGLLLLLLCLVSLNAKALLVSVNGYGDVPEAGLDITITEAEEDPLMGEQLMALNGQLIATAPLSVTITRSVAGVTDEFCCAGQCTAGNGETAEQLAFSPNGVATWYAHYMPMANSDVQITYTFSDGTESRQVRVRYFYSTEGLLPVTGNPSPVTVQKILRNGIIYILTENTIYHL